MWMRRKGVPAVSRPCSRCSRSSSSARGPRVARRQRRDQPVGHPELAGRRRIPESPGLVPHPAVRHLARSGRPGRPGDRRLRHERAVRPGALAGVGVSAVASFVTGFVLMVVILFFFLKDGPRMWEFVLRRSRQRLRARASHRRQDGHRPRLVRARDGVGRRRRRHRDRHRPGRPGCAAGAPPGRARLPARVHPDRRRRDGRHPGRARRSRHQRVGDRPGGRRHRGRGQPARGQLPPARPHGPVDELHSFVVLVVLAGGTAIGGIWAPCWPCPSRPSSGASSPSGTAPTSRPSGARARSAKTPCRSRATRADDRVLRHPRTDAGEVGARGSRPRQGRRGLQLRTKWGGTGSVRWSRGTVPTSRSAAGARSLSPGTSRNWWGRSRDCSPSRASSTARSWWRAAKRAPNGSTGNPSRSASTPRHPG